MKKLLSNTFNSSLIKIGDAAQLLGVSIDTLRRWEKKGLISPIKTPGGTRLYDLNQIKSLGLSPKLSINQPILASQPKVDPPTPLQYRPNIVNQSQEIVSLRQELKSQYQEKESAKVDNPQNQLRARDQVDKTAQKGLFLTLVIVAIILSSISALGVLGFKYIPSQNISKALLSLIPKRTGPKLNLQFNLEAARNLTKNALTAVLGESTPSGKYLEINTDTKINGALIGRTLDLSSNETVGGQLKVSGAADFASTITGLTLGLTSPTKQLILGTGNTVTIDTSPPTGSFLATIPALSSDDTFLFLKQAQALTNKTISGSNNTLTSIANSSLINSKVTISTSGILTGGGDVTLGSSLTLSLSAINLSGSSVTGVLGISNGGTNSTTTPTAGAVAYGTGTAYAFTAAGSSGQVLSSNGSSTPTWISVAAASCPTCILTNPSSTQTITPTAATAIGLSVAQASSGSVDIFNVTNNAGSTKYFEVDSSGNVGIAATTINDALDVVGNIDTSTYYKLSDQKILSVAGTNSLILGQSSGGSVTTGAFSNTIVGNTAGITLTTGDYNSFFGSSSGWREQGDDNTYIGIGSGQGSGNHTAYFNVGLGYNSLSKVGDNAYENVALGPYAGADQLGGSGGSYNIVIGSNADVSSSTINSSVVLGPYATGTASNQFVLGSATNTYSITDSYWGSGVTDSAPSDFTFNAAGGSGSNIAGANLNIAGGKGTGSAAGGSVIFKTSVAGVSGSSLQSLSTKMTITANGSIAFGPQSPTAATGTLANGLTFIPAAASSGVSLAAEGSDSTIALSIDSKSTGALNLNNTATGDVLIAGGSSSTGCTITNSTGGLACSGNITGSSSGTVGFWSRSSTTLSPATSNDIVSISSNSSTALLTLSPSGVTGIGLAVGALSGTTANTGVSIGAISGSGATGTGITIGAISTTGTTNKGIDIGTLTGGTTANYQINTGVLTSATTTTNAQINLGGVVTTGGTTNYGINVGALSGTGTTNYGQNISTLTSVGTTNYGLNIGGATGAATTNYGLVVGTVSGATTNYGALLQGTWFTGGSATTTKPQLLVEPSGTTSTGWSTSGTGLGVNSAQTFAGNLLDLQQAGISTFKVAGVSTAVNGFTFQTAATTNGVSLSATGSDTNIPLTISSKGTGTITLSSAATTGTGTSGAFAFTANSLSSGTGSYFSSSSITQGILVDINTGSANTLTSGTLLNISSTATSLTSGRLASLDWTPGSATTATGDLFRLTIGANGTTTGNLFNIVDGTSSIFSVSETAMTTSLPSNFTSAGDVAIAYDLNFTNPTSSYITSSAPLYLRAGESFNSSDLTLQTYNRGSVIVDQENTVASSATSYSLQVLTNLIDNGVNPTSQYGIYNLTTSGITGDTLATLYSNFTGLTNNAGTITTWYGDYIAAPTGSGTTSTKYALVSEAGAGNVGIGTTTPSYKLDIATSTANDRGINIAQTATTGTNYGIYAAVTGAATANVGGYFQATGATTSRGLEVAALTSATSTGLTIGALSGTTANTGVSIGAISGASATGTGVDIGNLTNTGATQYGVNIGALSGTHAAAGGTSYGINIGAISSAGTTSTNAGLNIGNISGATSNNYGIQIGTLTGGAGSSVYGISSGTLTSVASGTNYQVNLGAVAGASSATFGGINTGALSGAGTTSYGLNLGANSSTATTNYGVNIGAISGAGTTNYGVYIGAVSGATSNYALVTNGGNVGIGTATPSFVSSSVGSLSTADRAVAAITNNNTTDSANTVTLRLNTGATSTTTNARFETYYAGVTSGDTGGTAVGHINLNNNAVNYATSGADYAEELVVSENSEPGDVISLSTASSYQKSRLGDKLIGVVSDTTGFTGNSREEPIPGENRASVGLLGQIRTKVSNENGTIARGDLLTTSSIRGVAMKATKPGQVIGKALEDYSGDGIARILAFVSASYGDPGNVLANLTLDSSGQLIIPQLKVGKLVLDPNMAANQQEATGAGTLAYQVMNLESRVRDLEANSQQPTASSFSETLNTIASLQNNVTQIATDSAILRGSIAGISTQVASASAQIQTTANRLQTTQDQVASIAAGLTEVRNQTSDIRDLNLTPPDILLATGSAQLANLNIADKISTLKLNGFEATFSGTLRSVGETYLARTNVAGDLVQDGMLSISEGNSINVVGLSGQSGILGNGVLYLQNSSLAQGLDIFNGKVFIDKDGSVTLQKLVISATPVAGAKADPSIGSGIIAAGETNITIYSNQVTSSAKIFVTPRSKTGSRPLVVEKITPEVSFKVSLEYPYSSDIGFDWWIVETLSNKI